HLAVAALAMLALSTMTLTAPVFAQAAPGRPNALVEFPPKEGAHLTVTTPAWPDGGDIPFQNTQYRGNVFPGLSWTAGPQGTKSYAIIMQDTDGSRDGAPILHWTMYNPPGSFYGPNARGESQPYMGPRTPPGPKHHYHLQVFALDTTLNPDPAMT